MEKKVYGVEWNGELIKIHLNKFDAHSDYRWERKDLRDGMKIVSFYLTPTGEDEEQPTPKEDKESE